MRHSQAITAALFAALTSVVSASPDFDPLLLEPVLHTTAPGLPNARTVYRPTAARPGWQNCHVPIWIDPDNNWIGSPTLLAAEQQLDWGPAGVTLQIVPSEPKYGAWVAVLKSPNSGGWSGVGAGEGATLMSLPDDGSLYQRRVWVHEFAHAFGLGHGHQHPHALRLVKSIDYGRIPPASMPNWLPNWPGLLLNPHEIDPLDSITAYYSAAIDYGDYPGHRHLAATAGDVLAVAELCARWLDPDGLPLPTRRPDEAPKFARWDTATDVVTLTIPGGPDVTGGAAPARLSADADWGMTPLRMLEGWTHDGDVWTASFTVQDAAAACGKDLHETAPKTGCWLHWSNTDAPVESEVSIVFKVAPCVLTPTTEFQDCIFYFRGFPVRDGVPGATSQVLAALTGPARSDSIFVDGFES